jgi:hypothetical protein
MSDSSTSSGTSTKKGSSCSDDGVGGVDVSPVALDADTHESLFSTTTRSSSSPEYTPTSCGRSSRCLSGLRDSASLLGRADSIRTLALAELQAYPQRYPISASSASSTSSRVNRPLVEGSGSRRWRARRRRGGGGARRWGMGGEME